MAEPVPGYFASDPQYPPALCEEMYNLLGPSHPKHFHPTSWATESPGGGFGLGGFGLTPFGE